MVPDPEPPSVVGDVNGDGVVNAVDFTCIVVNFLKEGDPINPYLSGGIRPLELSDEQSADLVAFMKTLTSPEYADLAGGQFIEVQGTAEGHAFTREEFDQLMDLAALGIEQIVDAQNAAIAEG